MTDASHDADPYGGQVTPEVAALAASTLDEIDPPTWGPPPPEASSLVRRTHALRSVPIAQLGIGDLRLLIAQGVARATLVPIALGMLRVEPLLEGDYYPGDLLFAVMRVPDAYWAAHPDQHDLLRGAISRLDPADAAYPSFDDGEFGAAVARHVPVV